MRRMVIAGCLALILGVTLFQGARDGAALLDYGPGRALAADPQVGEDIVVNGDFETPFVSASFVSYSAVRTFGGWTLESGGLDHIGSLWQPASVRQSLDLNSCSPATIYQDLATIPGRSYLLRFALAGNTAGGPSIKQMEAWWGADKVDTLSFSVAGRTPSQMGWRYNEYTVTAPSDSIRLKFKSVIGGCYGPALDDVSVTLLAAPPTAVTLSSFGASYGLSGWPISVALGCVAGLLGLSALWVSRRQD